MNRSITYERRASFWTFAYFAALSAIIPALATAGYGFLTQNAPLGIFFALLCVLLYFAADAAAGWASYWQSRAKMESRFETIETLSRPIYKNINEQ